MHTPLLKSLKNILHRNNSVDTSLFRVFLSPLILYHRGDLHENARSISEALTWRLGFFCCLPVRSPPLPDDAVGAGGTLLMSEAVTTGQGRLVAHPRTQREPWHGGAEPWFLVWSPRALALSSAVTSCFLEPSPRPEYRAGCPILHLTLNLLLRRRKAQSREQSGLSPRPAFPQQR